MRVLFWGTPGFATPSLRALLGEGYDVVGVVTQPDKPVGRSRSSLLASPVKKVAVEEGIPVLQPERPRGEHFLAAVRALDPEISIVAAYGHILRAEVLSLPVLGSLNVHASLLPALRGAAPIQAAIVRGCTETGITIMRMVQALDAGPVLTQVKTPISEDETYGELQLRLSELGALALIEALTLIGIGAVKETPQDDASATYAPKIDRAMTRIRWREEGVGIARAIRGYDPRPGATTTLGGIEVKLFGAHAVADTGHTPGKVVEIGGQGMVVACGLGAIRVQQVQPAGKKRMAPADWARGRGIAIGAHLGE
ncbi:MAG: methionyl-tRNA formyltransferase [Gemmatimonadaceae bacterium]